MAATHDPISEQRRGLFLLGGAPRAGKSQLAQQLWRNQRIVSYGMDATVLGLMRLAPEVGVNWVASPERDDKISVLVRPVARWGAYTYGRYLIEGESITPGVANRLRDEFNVAACFMVMSDPTLEAIEAHETLDPWVSQRDADKKARVLDDIRVRTEMIQHDCKVYDFPWVDMSTGAYVDRVQEVVSVLMTQERSFGTARTAGVPQVPFSSL